MAANKHVEVIHAWAEGAQIQARPEQDSGCDNYWTDQEDPRWYIHWQYRIKPAEPERVYPVTQMTDVETFDALYSGLTSSTPGQNRITLVNAALRHACDAGQIVTREEFDRAVGDRKKRDMDVAKHVHDEIFRLANLGTNVPKIAVKSFLNIEKLIEGFK